MHCSHCVHESLSPSSYMLSPWLPAYEFSHLILFLVGLWALLDRESLEAVVSVSLRSFNLMSVV